jgi:hypothetical protein
MVTPFTFLFTGFGWLVLAALIGIAMLLGQIYGTPMPKWLRTVHAHGALMGGLLQLLIGGLLASIAHVSEERQSRSRSHTGLFLLFNGTILALIASLGYEHMQLAGVIGLAVLLTMISIVKTAWDYVREELAESRSESWIYAASGATLFIGLLLGIGMCFRFAPEFFAHTRLLHLHLVLLGFLTTTMVVLTHRLLPVLLRRELASANLGQAIAVFLFAGFLALIGGFVTSSLRVELVVGGLLLSLAMLYAVNLFRTWIASDVPGNAAIDHLLLAALFLVLTTGSGVLMAANYLPETPVFPIGSLHMVAYTHAAFLGFMINSACGGLSHGLPVFLAASRVPNVKRRGPYRERLDSIMNRWRMVQLVGICFGSMGLAVAAALTWTAPLGSPSVQIAAWVAAGLLLAGLTMFAVKIAWVAGITPDAD